MIDGAVHVADLDGRGLAAVEGPAVGVLSVPGEEMALIRSAGKGRGEEPAGNGDGVRIGVDRQGHAQPPLDARVIGFHT